MQETAARATASRVIPFDAAKLDRLMEDAGLDVLIATSKHNVQYLLGAERAIFFDYMDALGVSRYLPVLVYPKGAPEKAIYVGHRMETHQRAVAPPWVPELRTESNGSVDAITRAAGLIRDAGVPLRRVGVEMAFLPMDAGRALADVLPGAELKDAVVVLERLRAVKSAAELAKLKTASELVIASMLAVIAGHGRGTTKQQLADALRLAEANRGLTFEYCLLACGSSHNRAPSSQHWQQGEVLSLDSGGNYRGYIGDLARMAVLGKADAELKDYLAEIEAVQRAAFAAVRPGAMGGDIYVAAERQLAQITQRDCTDFLAHGMGLVSHEAPRLTARGPVPYDDTDARQPLEAGMVVSIETTMKHPTRGFIKLEDTVAVTPTGYEIFGEGGRGWNLGGNAL
ncbi:MULTISPECIES: M24 family metallopeptidase [Bradyrhizobium]|uniref:Aminopeptidase P family protein n=1 Tax=Bradyrhizobium zhanjiangense TaxID=1325107 RepID=A0A4Q0QNW9_9BRAD|nr:MULTISPECIES: Xaa-Pro peptidase family protein [Bradyrhizobium]RXG97266.1 aminopeptidase P family protein [Bradyrhizobium zhanjiangense]UQR67416.1 Xaa-Pro peptidase family protein [Bradyrhizobium sp. C-145]